MKHSKSVFKELLLVCITSIVVFTGLCQGEEVKVTVDLVEPEVTVSPAEECRVLKEQMDLKALELDSVLKRVEGLESANSLLNTMHLDLVKNVTGLSDMLDMAVFSLTGLNVSEAALLSEVQSTTDMLTKMNSSFTKMETSNKELSSNVGSMSNSFNRMNTSLKRMAELNHVWRNNFRVVNTTFRNIRKKVNFPVPAFNLGKIRDDETW